MDRRGFLLSGVPASLAARDRVGCDILVQGAVDGELGPLLEALRDKKERRIEAWTFWSGRMGEQRVVVNRTDVGPINAAAATALGIREFRPGVVINQGTAGGHHRKLKLWDIVLGERATDYSAYKSDHGDEKTGSQFERRKPIPHTIRSHDGKGTAYPSFPGDLELLEKARRVKYERGALHVGNLGSAYQFNKEIDVIDWVHRTYGTDTEDMETAYCAGAAVAMKTRFLGIRIISDTEWDHPTFERIAGQYCAEFVRDVIVAL